MRPGNLLSGFQGGQRGVVVRLFGDFVHQLAVGDLIVFIDYDHTHAQPGQPADRWRWRRRSSARKDAPRQRGREVTYIAQAFRAAEAGPRARPAGQRKCTALRCCQFSGQLVEFTH